LRSDIGNNILFAEGPATLVISIDPNVQANWDRLFSQFLNICIGKVLEEPALSFIDEHNNTATKIPQESLLAAWNKKLPLG
jgi:hypothetical protein